MSRERELLNRCAVNLRVRNICPLLLKEVSELLNEPQQEPIAWAIVFDAEPNKVCEDYLSPYKEDLEVVMEKGFCKGDIPRLRPLYIAPPIREPLSNLAIKEASRNSKDMSFYNGVKWAEEQHGIGVGDE